MPSLWAALTSAPLRSKVRTPSTSLRIAASATSGSAAAVR